MLIGDLGFALAQQLLLRRPGARRSPPGTRLCTELVMGQYLDVAGAAGGGSHPHPGA